jgi:hypothetical protein
MPELRGRAFCILAKLTLEGRAQLLWRKDARISSHACKALTINGTVFTATELLSHKRYNKPMAKKFTVSTFTACRNRFRLQPKPTKEKNPL